MSNKKDQENQLNTYRTNKRDKITMQEENTYSEP